MTPEASRHLGKAEDLLVQAEKAIAADLADAAGRAAYLSGFHAAQAIIFDRTGQVTKTHRGVHAAFALVAKSEPAIGQKMRAFLGRAYNLKALADYDTDPGSQVSRTQAIETIADARQFVRTVAELLGK